MPWKVLELWFFFFFFSFPVFLETFHGLEARAIQKPPKKKKTGSRLDSVLALALVFEISWLVDLRMPEREKNAKDNSQPIKIEFLVSCQGWVLIDKPTEEGNKIETQPVSTSLILLPIHKLDERSWQKIPKICSVWGIINYWNSITLGINCYILVFLIVFIRKLHQIHFVFLLILLGY